MGMAFSTETDTEESKMNFLMRQSFPIAFLFLLSFLPVLGAEWKPGGWIQGKNGVLRISKDGRLLFSDNGGSIGWIHAMRNRENEILLSGTSSVAENPEERSFSWKMSAGKSGKFDPESACMDLKISLLPDGRTARFFWRTDPEVRKNFREHKLMLVFRDRLFGGTRKVIVDGKDSQFDTFRRGSLQRGKAKKIVLDLPADRSRLVFTLVQGRLFCDGWWNNGKNQYTNFILTAEPENGILILDIDLDSLPEASADSVRIAESINLAPNRFRMPDFTKCRNLLQNPSFEDGVRFWTLTDHCKPLDTLPIPEHGFLIDESTAVHGRRSYRHTIFNTSTCMPATLAYPTIPGQRYTFSFYAKTDVEGGYPIQVTGYTQYGEAHATTRIPRARFHVGNSWKRYHCTFQAPNKMAQFILWVKGGNLQGTRHIWFDAFQLEKGEGPTPFATKPVSSVLETTRTDNLQQPGTDFKPTFRVVSGNPVSGTLNYTVRDIFKRVAARGSLPFRTAGKWIPSRIAVPDGFRQLDYGAYLIETEIVTDHFTDLVFDRLNLIEYLDGKHDLKNQFGILLTRSAVYNVKQRLLFWHHVGAGVLYPALFNRELSDLALRLGFKTGIPLFGKYLPTDTKSNETDFLGKYNLKDASSLRNFRREDLPAVEDFAYRMARRFPWNRRWKSINEPSPDVAGNELAIQQMLAILRAADRGIKRANPKNILLMPEMPGVYPEFVAKMWKLGGPSLFPEGITSHLYIRWPEEPDIDRQTENMIRAVNDPSARFAYPESSTTFFYNLPELSVRSLDNATCGDFARAGHLATYDLGLGEQLALANRIRFRLPIIKRKAFFDTQDDFYLDLWNFFDMGGTSSSMIFSLNTLGRLLNGARFLCEPMFGDFIRCYLFEDREKRPVAVIWNYHASAYFSETKNPYLDLSDLKQSFEILNICGGKEKIPEDRRLRIGCFPFFLRGEAGKTEDFRNALERLDLIGGNASEFKLETGIQNGMFSMSIRNVRAKTVSGELTVTWDGKKILSRQISIPSRGAFPFQVRLPESRGLKRTQFVISMKTEKTEIVKKYDLDYFEIHPLPRDFVPDGGLEKWKGVSPVEIPHLLTFPCYLSDPVLRKRYQESPEPYRGAGDFSARLYAGYTEENLYLTICVRDNVFRQPDPPVRLSYRFDSLQLYFDSFADARNIERPVNGHSQDDQTYDICTLDGKTLSFYRSLAPYIQLAFNHVGEEPRMQGSFRKTPDGYIYDLKLPQKTILPVKLKKGSSTGISLLLNDNDGDYRKRGLSLNPVVEPFRHPEYYPVLLMR